MPWLVSPSSSPGNIPSLPQATGLWWTYNVRDNGAKGDGITDDTAAIQAAINAAKLKHGTVFLPPGTYLISSALTIYLGVHLVGASRFGTTLQASATGTFTNGSRSNFPAMLKWDGGDQWAHGVIATEITFATNSVPGLSAWWFQVAGETSYFHNCGCSNTAPVNRKVSDAQLTAGSTTVTFTASTFTEDDVNAILTMAGGLNADGSLVTPAPAAPTLAQGTGGTITTGGAAQTFNVGITYLTANSETNLSSLSAITIPAGVTNASIVITSPPVATGATGWVAYVSTANAGAQVWRQQAAGSPIAIGTNYQVNTPTNTSVGAFNKIERINWGTNSSAATATSITLRYPAMSTLSGVTMTVARPTDAFVFDGGGVAGSIGTLNGTNNSGALLRIKNSVGSMSINQLSGDDNIGGMLRISAAQQGGDPGSVTVNQIKAESDLYNPNWQYSHDPVILLDRCWTASVNLLGASIIGGSYVRDVIRLDNSWSNTDVGGPSLFLAGIEGQNWYNATYNNIVRDTITGETIPVSGYGDQSPYPNILWNRHLKLGGGADIPGMAPWHVSLPLALGAPPIAYNGATWNSSSGSYFMGVVGYNQSNAQNDGFGWSTLLGKGTWKMHFDGGKGTNAGILTFDFSQDGGTTWTTIGTLDEYAAAAGWATADFTNITIPKTGRTIIRIRVLSRNASNTTGWVLNLSGITLYRTA